MTDNNYPPLPKSKILGFDNCEDEITGYTSAQMHAYIDADRAQRKPLTDEECWRLICAANSVSSFDDEEQSSHIPDDVLLFEPPWRFFKKQAEAMRAALNTPPRPDAGNN